MFLMNEIVYFQEFPKGNFNSVLLIHCLLVDFISRGTKFVYDDNGAWILGLVLWCFFGHKLTSQRKCSLSSVYRDNEVLFPGVK